MHIFSVQTLLMYFVVLLPNSLQLDSIYLFHPDGFFAMDQLLPDYHSHLFGMLLVHLSLQILFGTIHN